MYDKLGRLLARYRSLGIVKGGELLLPPSEIRPLIDDLEALGVTITGVDGWYFIDRDKALIAQDLGIDMSVSATDLCSPNAAQKSAVAVRDFIATLPKEVDLVSLTLDVPPSWDFFLVG